jgi:hypothetical protein
VGSRLSVDRHWPPIRERVTTLVEQEARTVREVVGVFNRSADLQDAIDELLSSGFDRAELSLLASEHAVEEKLGHRYEKVSALAEDPTVPRAAYVSTEAIGGAEGGIIGALMYVGAAARPEPLSSRGARLQQVSLQRCWRAERAVSSAQSWPNGSAITMRIIYKSRWTVEACCYGCGPGILRTKGAPSKFSESIREAMSTSTRCR